MAVSQSGDVARLVTERTGRQVKIVGMTTFGDISKEQLTQIGGTGVFVSGVRESLLRGEVDFVVHSLKDLPTGAAPGIMLAAIPRRDDPRDALVARDGLKLADLPSGARIGTGSPRRAAQLSTLRTDVTCVAIRGNANTRLGKVRDGELDAVVLAYAGLARIGHTDLVSEIFEPDAMVPAPGQGALAVLEAGCSAPVGAYAVQTGTGRLHLDGIVLGVAGTSSQYAALDTASGFGRMVIKERGEADVADAASLGRELAERMLALGAAGLMRGENTNGNDVHD
jgi:hydroxymethylbilane synthase